MKEVLIILMAFKGEIDAKYLQQELESFYDVRCHVKTEYNMPKSAYDSNYHRYNAGKILDYQLVHYPHYNTLAITSQDIGISKRNGARTNASWGILGYGIVGEQVAVMSVYRSKHNKQRAVKVLLHEFGHGLGLPHCNSGKPCMMKDARGKIFNLDRQPKALCINCKIKLRLKTPLLR